MQERRASSRTRVCFPCSDLRPITGMLEAATRRRRRAAPPLLVTLVWLVLLAAGVPAAFCATNSQDG